MHTRPVVVATGFHVRVLTITSIPHRPGGRKLKQESGGAAPLFIVDNAEDGRSGIDYLRQWCELSSAIDIATGYFEIGSLLGLDGEWQKVDRIRILMGDEMTGRTKAAMLKSVRDRVTKQLDEGIEQSKPENPFLEGVAAIVDAMESGRIECRVYTKDKFHAKAFITHGRLEVVGSKALVGSSNFTFPGLTQNVELNVMEESNLGVAQLQEWYEKHWDEAEEITEDVLRVIRRHTEEFTPFDIWTRSLKELFAGDEPNDAVWEETRSVMFPRLDRYQKEGYWAAMDIANRFGGAFVCDGVGLGKTYVGLMLLERLVVQDNKRVVLFAPKSVTESVWVPEIERHLPHIGGTGTSQDFSSLSVFNHTDLSRKGNYPERFHNIMRLADAVVIDEAHHFRNRGKGAEAEEWDEWSRYFRMFEVINGMDRPKRVFMLTATPINNSLNDFRHLVELYTGGDDSHFARTLGVNSVAARLNGLTKGLKERQGEEVVEFDQSAAEDVLGGDVLFQRLVVQRSRAYARESQMQEVGEAAAFPERGAPEVAGYSIRKTYGNLLELLDDAFSKEAPLFSLAMYYPLYYYKGERSDIDPFDYERQKQVVGLIRTNFLKRFESSVYSFERSCDRLLRKLMAFLEVNVEDGSERDRYDRWVRRHEDLLAYAHARQLELFGDEDDEDEEEDLIPPELLARAEKLDRSEFRVEDMILETMGDLDQLGVLLTETRKFDVSKDDKLKKLKRLLTTKDLADQKVLVFTEFADTARYIRKHLVSAGIEGVAEVDSGTKIPRATVIRRFAPYYNGSSSGDLEAGGEDESRVLISTDVLSEGLNLQDATRLVNYDIHWNPVRLMQRIGRVDRRLNPDVEARIVADHPEMRKRRGKVRYYNFLPPDELDLLLKLYGKVAHKALLISRTLGIEGGKLLKPEDEYEALKEFNAAYEGTISAKEEMLLEYQQLLDEHPDLDQRLNSLPSGVFSGRKQTSEGSTGVFFCFRLPALDPESDEFTLEAGTTHWYLLPSGSDEILDEPTQIAAHIRSKPATQRVCSMDSKELRSEGARVLKHIRNSYLKQVGAPIDAPSPKLVCWMELNEG